MLIIFYIPYNSFLLLLSSGPLYQAELKYFDISKVD